MSIAVEVPNDIQKNENRDNVLWISRKHAVRIDTQTKRTRVNACGKLMSKGIIQLPPQLRRWVIKPKSNKLEEAV